MSGWSFSPGTIVNDCDGFNHVIEKPIIQRFNAEKWMATNFKSKGTKVCCIDQFKFTDGKYSCGCPYGPVPAWTVKEIEDFHWIDNAEEYFSEQRKLGWSTEGMEMLQEKLERGEPICTPEGFKIEFPKI